MSTSPSPKPRECWICLTDDDRPFVRPCLCRGSTKFVHNDCFESFVKTKNLSNFRCNFCKAKYRIDIPYHYFILTYELISRISGHFCTWIFIVSIALIAYTLLFVYGVTAIITIIGVINFNTYLIQEVIFPRYLFRLFRLVIGAPMIPIYLCLSLNQKFSFVSHVLPLLLLIDSFSLKWLGLYMLLALFYAYCRIVRLIESKLGSIQNLQGGIMINNHQIAIKELVVALLSPFIGSMFGSMVFSTKKPLQSLLGIMMFMMMKDISKIAYLMCKNRLFHNIRILEYEE